MNKLGKKIVTLLKKKRLKLAVAESCTGGMLSSLITSISGSSKIFTMGLVTYSNYSKNLSKISKSNLAISIPGIAGPKGGTQKKPVGLVYIGIKRANKVRIIRCYFKNKGRSSIRKAAVRKALKLIFDIIN